MLRGKFIACFKLTGRWAPEALQAAREGLEDEQGNPSEQALSCASELIRKMGDNEEEQSMVAGFAGGLGLSGSGCGALAAALWKHALIQNKADNGKAVSFDPEANPVLSTFYKETDYEIECKGICGQSFGSTEAHTEYVKQGGCRQLIGILAEAASGSEH